MEIVKAGLIIAAALGSTWAAREATDALAGRPQTLVQSEQTKPPAGGGAPTPGQAEPSAAPEAPPAMSREELEDELKRAQAEIGGKPGTGEMEEFRPSRPLSADVAISMPSDI
jgi:hypothetical protein